jgi:hypothetical protein
VSVSGTVEDWILQALMIKNGPLCVLLNKDYLLKEKGFQSMS